MTRAIRLIVLAACASLLIAGSARAQSVDELVAKNIEARGGAEALKSVDALRLTGTVLAGGMEMPVTITMKRPNLVRQEMQVQGQTMVQAFDGSQAWVINPLVFPDGNAHPIEGPPATTVKDNADFDGPLLDYQSKGTKIEVQGTEEVNGRKAHKLRITRQSGAVQFLYLDAETGLEIKTATQVGQEGQTTQIESYPSDWRKVDGIMVPHAVEQRIGPQVVKVTFDKVEVVPELDTSIFQIPAK